MNRWSMIRTLIFWLPFLFWFSGCALFVHKPKPTPGPSREELAIVAENHVSDGIEYFKKQEFSRAIREWKTALRYIPEDAEVHNFMGIAYHRVGKLDSAIVEFQYATRLNPQYHQAWNNLGYMFFLKGEYRKALPYFEKALEINPYYDQARVNYQKCKEIIEGKLPVRALEIYENAARLDSLELKIKGYRRALRVDSNFVDAWNNLGVAYYYYGYVDSAIFCFKKALELNPDHPEVHNNIAFIMDASKQYEFAISHYQKAIRLKPNYVTAMVNLGDTYFHIKDYDSARRIWETALKFAPDDPDIQERLAKLNATGSPTKTEGGGP